MQNVRGHFNQHSVQLNLKEQLQSGKHELFSQALYNESHLLFEKCEDQRIKDIIECALLVPLNKECTDADSKINSFAKNTANTLKIYQEITFQNLR